MNVLVLDIGTSSMRGILFRKNGEKIFQVMKKYKSEYRKNGIVEQDIMVLENALYYIIRKFVEVAKDLEETIDVISITGQRSSVVIIDKQGNVLSKVIMWQDIRNNEICNKLSKYDDIISEKSGSPVNTIFSGSKITWLKENEEEVYRSVYKVLNIPSYIMYLMTGELKTDYTYGSRTNLMNIKECKWDLDLLELFEVKEEYLCELQPPGSIIGKITKDFSEYTGINQGINVVSAGGDQQCGAIGQGVYKEGRLSIVLGTGAFLVTSTDKVPDNIENGLICNASAINGKYIIEANVKSCCSAFNWYCENFYYYGEINYEKVSDELESVYMENGECLVLPYFQGRSASDLNQSAHAVFSNISLSTKRQDILKGILEGIFIEINNNIKSFKKYIDIDNIYVSGGLTKSKIINQMQSDIYGVPIHIMEESESTSLGALIITLYSLGVYNSIDDAFDTIIGDKKIDTYIINKIKYDEYRIKQDEINELYKKIY